MKKLKSKVFVGFLSLLIATLVATDGQAQSQEAYPTKPIEIICPSAAGGSTDLFSRTIATALSKKWGVPVNVVNKPGGNYIPGMMAFYNANPDGYTMLADGNATAAFLSVGVKDLPFKTTDRIFVGTVGTNPYLYAVSANSPFTSLAAVVAEAKRDPGNFSFTINGAGTDGTGFAMRQFFKAIDVDILKAKAISTAGGGPGLIMVVGGHVILGAPTLASAASALKGGTLRGLAITPKNRHPDWPDLPTTTELGYPNMNIIDWKGIAGPPKLPASIVAKWEKALAEIVRDPEVVARMRNFGMTASFLDSKATTEFSIKETEEAAKLWGVIGG